MVGITAEAIAKYGGSGVTYGTATIPTRSSSGGNSGGFMSASDPYAPTYGIDGQMTGINATQEFDLYSFDGGSDFNGTWPTRAYEGVLQFDYRLSASAGLSAYAITPGNVYIKGLLDNNLSYPWPASQPLPTSSWQTMTIYLSENAGWTAFTGGTVSQSVFLNTLSNVVRLRLPGDWLRTTLTGANPVDSAQIDNIYVRQGKPVYWELQGP